jgi:hypothetical protein
MIKTYPDARLLPLGRIVSFDTGEDLPNYEGPVYANLAGNPYIMWMGFNDCGERTWDIINEGDVIVQSELDKFIAEKFSAQGLQ